MQETSIYLSIQKPLYFLCSFCLPSKKLFVYFAFLSFSFKYLNIVTPFLHSCKIWNDWPILVERRHGYWFGWFP